MSQISDSRRRRQTISEVSNLPEMSNLSCHRRRRRQFISDVQFVSDPICHVTHLRQSQKAPICVGCPICRRRVQFVWDVQYVTSPHLRQVKNAPICLGSPIHLRSNLSGMSKLSQKCPICQVSTPETVNKAPFDFKGPFVPHPICLRFNPPAPMNHVKIFKGWPPRDAPSKLVQLWYKSFPPDQRGLVEMKNPTRLSNKTSNA